MSSRIVEYAFGGGLGIRAVYARGIEHCFPQHSHESFIIGTILNGWSEIVSGGSKKTIGVGGEFRLLPYQEHSCTLSGESGCDYFVLAVPMQVIQGTENDTVFDFFEKDLSLLNHRMQLSSSGYESVCQLFIQAKEIVMELRASGVNGMVTPEMVGRGLSFIKENYLLKLSLDDIASYSYMSKYNFLRVFKKYFGMSPRAYVDKKRIAEAITRINAGEPASGVAVGCGFSDQSHLCRVAKKITGVSAGKYSKVNL